MGTTPFVETDPTVGFNPTTPFSEAGQTIEPSVSVPIANVTMPAPTAAPEPELEPPTLCAKFQGFRVSPPTADHPLIDLVERRFAHSDKFVEPTMSAPASRSFVTSSASRYRTAR